MEPTPEPTPEPNRAPVVDAEAANYAGFTGAGEAPRGLIVTKPFEGIFSDPDGDQLLYFISAIGVPDHRIEHQIGIVKDGESDALVAESSRTPDEVMRVYFEADAEGDWDALDPPLAENPVITFELTALDPEGLTATVAGSFRIPWEPASCEPLAPSSVDGIGIERAAVISWTVPGDLGDGCEVTGFVVGATDSNGVDWENEIDDPDARKHVLRGLEPDDYHFYVKIVYDDGTSDELRTAYSHGVPHACDIILEVAPYTTPGFSASLFSGSWRTDFSKPSGCIWGPEIEFQWKRSEDDYYHRYGRFRNGFANSFIGGRFEPYVSYDFKIVAFNAAGERGESNVATTMIVSNDVSVTPDANSPRNVRVRANNNSSIRVTWERPESLGAGRTFTNWRVEWNSTDGTSSGSRTLTTQSETTTRIDGLTDGKRYVIRVAARTSGVGGARNAWSAPAPALTAWSEPTRLFFGYGFRDQRNVPNYVSGRMFVGSNTNKYSEAVVCTVNDGTTPVPTINCPQGTLVHLEVAADTEVTHSITAPIIGTDENDDGNWDSFTVSGWFGVSNGPRSPEAWASGGDGELFVEWQELPSTGGHTGTLDAYVIEHRQGASGAWTQTVITDTTARSRTVTGLTNGVSYQVRVRGRSVNSEDHDDNPITPDQDVHRIGISSEYLTVETNSSWTQPPRIPSNVDVTPGEEDRTLVVQWGHPTENDRSKAHAYQVRHRERGSRGDWTTSEVLYPYRTHRLCDEDFVCVSPRTYVIEDLIGGRDYEIATRAKNANGWGEWGHELGSAIPNGLPPVVDSASVSATGLSLTFDKALGATSPPASAFTVKATSGTTTRTISVSSVQAVSGTFVSLTLGEAVAAGETVTISYTKPETNPLAAATGEEVESFTDQPVTNSTP